MLWAISNFIDKSERLIEKAICVEHLFDIIAYQISINKEIRLEFYTALCLLFETITNYYKDEWYKSLTNFILELS